MKETKVEPEFLIDEVPVKIVVSQEVWAREIVRCLDGLRKDLSETKQGRGHDAVGSREFLKSLISTLDIRCGQMVRRFRSKDEGEELPPTDEVWLKRLESLQRALDLVLETYGVSVYSPSGQAVPGRDAVFEQVSGTGEPPGTIVKVIKNAYLWRGEVLSASLVCTAE